ISGSKSLRLATSFFFQAEDGIRDFHVTGVQTCALPIWHRQHVPLPVRYAPPRSARDVGRHPPPRDHSAAPPPRQTTGPAPAPGRSEERRVGKEERSRQAQ